MTASGPPSRPRQIWWSSLAFAALGALLLAGPRSGHAIASLLPLDAQEGMPRIVIDPTDRRGRIDPTVYGVNHRYPYNGFEMWDPLNQQPYPEFVAKFAQANFKLVRFPGARSPIPIISRARSDQSRNARATSMV